MGDQVAGNTKPGMDIVKRYLLRIGVLVFLAGYFYDIFFVNIPPQDPPPGLIRTYTIHEEISDWVQEIGMLLIVVGVIFKLFRIR
jgi:hypothetical protein